MIVNWEMLTRRMIRSACKWWSHLSKVWIKCLQKEVISNNGLPENQDLITYEYTALEQGEDNTQVQKHLFQRAIGNDSLKNLISKRSYLSWPILNFVRFCLKYLLEKLLSRKPFDKNQRSSSNIFELALTVKAVLSHESQVGQLRYITKGHCLFQQ